MRCLDGYRLIGARCSGQNNQHLMRPATDVVFIGLKVNTFLSYILSTERKRYNAYTRKLSIINLNKDYQTKGRVLQTFAL